MDNKIRIATIKDVRPITALNKRYFHEAGRDWHALVSGNSSEMVVLQHRGRVIGFSGLIFHRWNTSARIIDIFVHPEYRHRGYGTALVKFLLRRARRRNVRTVMAEAPSKNSVLHVYVKCKFRVCGYNDRYYSNSGNEIAVFLSYDFRKK